MDEIFIVGQNFNLDTASRVLTPGILKSSFDFYNSPTSPPVKNIYSNCVFDGSDTEWAACFNMEYNSEFLSCKFIGGSKGVLDILRSGNIEFTNCEFIDNKSSFPIVIRASSHSINFRKCNFIQKSKKFFNAFFCCGMWSIYDFYKRPFCRRITIDECDFQCSSIFKTLSLYSIKPEIKNCKALSVFVPSFIVDSIFRFIRLFLKVIKKEPSGHIGKLYEKECM